MPQPNIPIFIVDDESAICETLEAILRDEGYEVESFPDAESFQKRILDSFPALVLLDIWLPGLDGMEMLSKLKEKHPDLPVIMMSGHAGIESAVSSIKLGAYDFLEKPLHLEVLLDKISGALFHKGKLQRVELPSDMRTEIVDYRSEIKTDVVSLVDSEVPQRTLRKNVVLNGTGLLSGRNTGIILSPLEVDQGIIFQMLDGQPIRAHITSLEDFSLDPTHTHFTANSTALVDNNKRIRTVEHLLAALHMFGVTNVSIKSDEEIPNIDGSADEFCKLIQEAGIEDQAVPAKKAVIHKKIALGEETLKEKYIYVEPADEFEVIMRVDYPAPIFEQKFTFNPRLQSFQKEIAPARSFNTFENIDMAQKQGKVGSGYLYSHIIMYDGKVINTELRYPDEFVRHKILDLIGDLYLLGYPIQGRVVANMTSHAYNQALVQQIYTALISDTKS
ncbi:UDP-3-O-acyl-N-acetylglucosamine deacetylase [Deltaproteobacteria bacterium TL4]